MRAACVLVVVCAVAAGAAGGAARGDLRAAAGSAAVTRGAPASLRTAAVHPALHAALARSGRRHPPGTRAGHPSFPPVALAAGWSIDPLRRALIAPLLPVADRRTERPIRTGSARGPPIA